jgi:hypothetical protein
MQATGSVSPIPRLAWTLGVAGLLPFFAHALFVWLTPVSEAAGLLKSQVHYAGAILTFVGALHWGVAIAGGEAFTPRAGVQLVWSVIPALYAWVISLYPPPIAVPAFLFGLACALLVDFVLFRGVPGARWFVQLRTVISVVAVVCMGVTWLALATRLDS